MSAFEQEKSPAGKKTWADSESESDHDEDNRGKKSVGHRGSRHGLKNLEGEVTAEHVKSERTEEEGKNDDNKAEEEDEEEEEEEEEEEAILGAITHSATAKKTPKQPERPLSRKEREELRRKELEDLDSLLSQLGSNVASSAEAIPIEAVPASLESAEQHEEGTGGGEASRKRRSKKKAPGSGIPAAAAPLEDGSAVSEGPRDVAAILKARARKGPGKRAGAEPGTGGEAQRIAMQEAKKAAEAAKKKRDKSKFSEGSY